jgi:hypothetical protein
MAMDVQAYLDSVGSQKRRKDAHVLVELMERVTAEQPRMWGTVVGFGQYHYRYESGREGDAPAAGFAARKAASTVYVLDGVGAYGDLLDKLGPHTTGVGCIYIKDASQVDLDVLGEIVAQSYTTLTADTYRNRARDAGGT